MIYLNVKGWDKTISLIQAIPNEYADDIRNLCTMFMLNLQTDIKNLSPVGEKRGGTFRASWELISTDTETGFTSVLSNNMPYALPLELGSEIGGRPWPSAGPRTIEQDGRIYSDQAPGGIVNVILDDGRLEDLNTLFGALIENYE